MKYPNKTLGCVGETDMVLKANTVHEPEPKVSPIIRVDYSVKPNYPNAVKEALHPDLESTGPAEYDITRVEQWLHKGQNEGRGIEGNEIYTYLKGTPDKPGDLKNHLGTRDLEEIMKMGVEFFRMHYNGKRVYGWKGVVRYYSGNLFVPYLIERHNVILHNLDFLGFRLDSCCPGLRHAS